jgi:predicted esterase
VLLHGSGGDETTMMALASRIAPRSVLMGVRGRVVQDGSKRWYARLTPTRFDQRDIRSEANAFAGFLQDAVKKKMLDLDHTTFVGYSNGANLLAALTLLHPGLVERAVLLRPMSVLEKIPAVDLSSVRYLVVAGQADVTYSPFAPALEAMLKDHGARIDAHMIQARRRNLLPHSVLSSCPPPRARIRRKTNEGISMRIACSRLRLAYEA